MTSSLLCFRSVLLLVLWAGLVTSQLSDLIGDKSDDLVTSLPGLSGTPGFTQYSGYLHGGGARWIHYWLVESESAPKLSPLVLWLNGGPGCSSVDGLITENGPFLVNPDGKTLRTNPYSWNKIANVLYIESPAGAGFSYAADNNYTVNDDLTAEENHLALKSFLRRFPEYKGRDFYVTGESYAGVYIPTLLVRIKDDPLFDLNIKGAAIGNALLSTVLTISKLAYFYHHGMLGAQDWKKLTDACCSKNDCSFHTFPSKECQQQIAGALIKVLSEPINPYNIYSDCRVVGSAIPRYNRQRRLATFITFMFRLLSGQFDDPEAVGAFVAASRGLAEASPCSDTAPQQKYFNSMRVRKALHIRAESPLWTTCSTLLDHTYTPQYSDVTPFLRAILDDKKYRLLLYNGDLDTVCDFLGDEAVVDSIDLTERRPRQPWFYTDDGGFKQIGGFVHEYQNLTFMTVKGSGHMVPTDQPAAAYTMYQRFLQGVTY